jgi:hypothetical protein
MALDTAYELIEDGIHYLETDDKFTVYCLNKTKLSNWAFKFKNKMVDAYNIDTSFLNRLTG